MVSVASLAVVYVVGGLTFLPLCAALTVAALYYLSPVASVPLKTGIPSLVDQDTEDAQPQTVYRAGWLTVRRTYEPMKEGTGDGSYAGMLASSYRSFMDQRSRDPRRSKPKDRFFAVLKQKTLFLYEGEDQAECWAAIDVAAHDVVIFPEGNVDGELYVKRTAIELKPRRASDSDDVGAKDETASPVVGEPRSDDAAYDALTGKPLPWFIFAKVNSDKEDWCAVLLSLYAAPSARSAASLRRYHSLVLSSRLGYSDSATAVARDRALFEPTDMARLMEQIDQQPDSIPMRWFNALLGRVFLSAYRTSTLEDYLTSRIVRKLKRVKTPAMLSEIQVREVNVGASVPLFSKPMLKELTPEGDASMEVHVAYVGEARVTIETQATVSLGSRFKPYVVRLVLAVVLRELEGSLLVKVKQPPSNRVWFGFREIPRMALSVEPVVSTRQIKWSLVTGPIESRIRELVRLVALLSLEPTRAHQADPLSHWPGFQIAESLVLPHMDDLSFFDTRSEPLSRGGIYGPFLRRERPSQEEELSAPPRPDREVGPSAPEDAPEELIPGVDGAEVPSAEARQRRPEARRRRSSEGDHPLDLTPMTDSPLPSSSAAATPNPASASVKTAASSSSVASLANGLSASLASWREKNSSGGGNGASSATSIAGSTASSAAADGGAKRKSSWFAKAGSASSSSLAAGSVRGRGESTDSLASTTGASIASSSATTETGGTGTSTPQEEVSAAKLREILTRRAESREQEKARERKEALREEEEGPGEEEDEVSSAPEKDKVPARPRARSNLSLTAPSRGETAESLVGVPAPKDDAPLRLNEPAESAPAAAASPPALPSRPSWVKPVAAAGSTGAPTSSSGSSASTVAPEPSPGLGPSAVPAPPLRRHSPSASVDSPSTATGTLLSSWRTRATDKEALAAGVASAKESMRRWGANWAAKRAQTATAGGSGGDLDRPVGDGDAPSGSRGDGSRERGTEREAYRDYRARAASPAGSARREDATPRTPPRAIPAASGFRPGASSLPVVQVSPSTALGTSPTKAPGVQPPGGVGGAGYRPVQMMALPGIKDAERRQRVRDDHIGGGAGGPAKDEKPAAKAAHAEEEALVDKAGETTVKELATVGDGASAAQGVAQIAVEAASVVPPAPAEPVVASVSPALLDEAVQVQDPLAASAIDGQDASASTPTAADASQAADAANAVDRPLVPSTPPRTASPLPLDAPALPPRPEALETSPPPPLPPRKDDTAFGAAPVKTALPALPPRPGDRAPPPLPPRGEVKGEEEQEDELADEAGWGLDDSSELGAGGQEEKDTA